MKKLLTLFPLVALRATAQVNYGELRLRIADPSGAGIQASVELSCAGDGYDETFTSDSSGKLAVQTMPYGVYQIQVKKPGFAPYTTSVELRSALPVAAGAESGSGLPFEYEGTEADALAAYGPQVVDRVNFARGRIRPLLAVNASLRADLYKSEKAVTRLQVDAENLNNRLNVIDFGGLFSGNAIAPARSFALRLNTSF